MRDVILWVVGVCVLGLATLPALAVEFNDGGYHIIDYPIDDSVYVDYDTPNAGTQVDVVAGGTITSSLKGYGTSSIAIDGGTIGGVETWGESEVLMYSGAVSSLSVNIASRVEIYGGQINYLGLSDYSTGFISNGSITQGIGAFGDSSLWMSGGILSGDFYLQNRGAIALEGSNFQVNGNYVGYGDLASAYGIEGIDGSGYHFLSGAVTGILTNGDILDSSFIIYNDADITFVPEPATLVLLAMGIAIIKINRK